jgi:hypothetical protein
MSNKIVINSYEGSLFIFQPNEGKHFNLTLPWLVPSAKALLRKKGCITTSKISTSITTIIIRIKGTTQLNTNKKQ